jgi:mono/diheme cytochrome c family protein
VLITRAILERLKVVPVDAGPGNLNALSQGHYNNLGLASWLAKKGLLQPSTVAPPRPGFEGSVNLPAMWFAQGDTWAQWFAEIHDPSARNWIQSVSTSPVRPPKLVAAAKDPGVMLSSVHFDNIAEVQRLLGLVRPPQWPEAIFGGLDRTKVDQGRALYEQHCAECHARTAAPPNELGVVFKERIAADVGSDPTAYVQFAADLDVRAEGLRRVSRNLLALRQAQLAARVGPAEVANYVRMDSRGRPNHYALARDHFRDSATARWPRSGAAYWVPPLDGIFATAPYLHNGSVRTLTALLTAPDQRPTRFRTGSREFDVEAVGLRDAGTFLYDTTQPGKGNGGHPFGTALDAQHKAALIEYLKSR